jgi:predicted glycosyltransferase
MNVWVDLTASAHPLVFRPLVERLRAQGHHVEITARDYAQTLQLIETHGMTATVIGHHGGRSSFGKARQMWGRMHALRAWAKGRNFDVALAHGSHELTLSARRLGIPSATTFDYEWAWLQHELGCRAATRVVVPDSITPGRLAKASSGNACSSSCARRPTSRCTTGIRTRSSRKRSSTSGRSTMYTPS